MGVAATCLIMAVLGVIIAVCFKGFGITPEKINTYFEQN